MATSYYTGQSCKPPQNRNQKGKRSESDKTEAVLEAVHSCHWNTFPSPPRKVFTAVKGSFFISYFLELDHTESTLLRLGLRNH